MLWLARRLLPYLMVLGGLVLALVTLPTIVGGGEPSPTSVALADVSTASPKARWLTVTGGGLYLPDAVTDEQVKKSTGTRKITAWYVPFVAEADAVGRAKALANGTTRPAAKSLVLVRFSPDEFLRADLTADQVMPSEAYRPMVVRGVRASNVLFPQRLKDFVRAELSLPLESVVVIDYGKEPLQRGQAIVMAAIFSGIALLGVVWVVVRCRRPCLGGDSRPSPPPYP
jgi:hypothetical protein